MSGRLLQAVILSSCQSLTLPTPDLYLVLPAPLGFVPVALECE